MTDVLAVDRWRGCASIGLMMNPMTCRAGACGLVISLLLASLLQSPVAGKTITIGTGAGEIDYPTAQKTLELVPGDTVYIAPGVYGGLALSGIAGTATAPITIKAGPGTLFSSSAPHDNAVRDLAFVVFDGLTYSNYNGLSMHIMGASHDLVFTNISATKGGGFRVYDSSKVFDGGKASAFYNFKWQNCTFDDTGSAIWNEDWASVSNLVSMALDFEISGCTFKNQDNGKGAFSTIAMVKAFNLQVHDCTFTNIGVAASPIGHNVCIFYRGYATVRNNRFTRQWANDVRSFPLKLNALGYNGPDAVSRFYNNISWDKRKYPVFEHNGGISQKEIEDSRGYFSRTSAEVCFNTLYRSRVVDYVAPLVDIYATNIVIRNNLIIEPECDTPWNPKFDRSPAAPLSLERNYVFHIGTGLGSEPGIVVDHNLIFRSLELSGMEDPVSFVPSATSPVFNAVPGKIDYITTDFYHHPRYRGASADAGAVQRPF